MKLHGGCEKSLNQIGKKELAFVAGSSERGGKEHV